MTTILRRTSASFAGRADSHDRRRPPLAHPLGAAAGRWGTVTRHLVVLALAGLVAIPGAASCTTTALPTPVPLPPVAPLNESTPSVARPELVELGPLSRGTQLPARP